MIHPATELRYINDTIGYGVFATAFIPKGTLIWVLDDLDIELTRQQIGNMPEMLRKEIDKYAYATKEGKYILCWDLGRFMNHSCRPSSRALGAIGEIAVRDIRPDEELTCEYSTCLTPAFDCFCGAPGCRRTIRLEDIDTHWVEWDAEVQAALLCAGSVPQPIIGCIRKEAENQAFLKSMMAGQALPCPSHRELKPLFN